MIKSLEKNGKFIFVHSCGGYNENKIIKKVFERELKIKIVELKNIYKNKIIKLKVNKKQIGSDRLANAISVFNKKK